MLFFAYLIKGIISPAPTSARASLQICVVGWTTIIDWSGLGLPGTFHPNWQSRSLPDYSFILNLASPQALVAAMDLRICPHRPQPQVLSVICKQEDLLKSAKGHCPRHRPYPPPPPGSASSASLTPFPGQSWCLCPWALKSIHPSGLTTAKPVLPSSHQFPNTEPRTSRSSHSRIWDQLRRRPELSSWGGAHLLGVHSRPKQRGSTGAFPT